MAFGISGHLNTWHFHKWILTDVYIGWLRLDAVLHQIIISKFEVMWWNVWDKLKYGENCNIGNNRGKVICFVLIAITLSASWNFSCKFESDNKVRKAHTLEPLNTWQIATPGHISTYRDCNNKQVPIIHSIMCIIFYELKGVCHTKTDIASVTPK